MELGTRHGDNPDPLGLRLKPELLVALGHAGVDLLAYDGAPCSEAVGPLREAARRIEADSSLRSVGQRQGTIGSGVVEGLRWAAERCADRMPGVTLRIRPWDVHGSARLLSNYRGDDRVLNHA
jgi:hypothetical protein